MEASSLLCLAPELDNSKAQLGLSMGTLSCDLGFSQHDAQLHWECPQRDRLENCHPERSKQKPVEEFRQQHMCYVLLVTRESQRPALIQGKGN